MILSMYDPYSGKDLKDPAMLVKDNPLASNECPCVNAIEERNRERLYADARFRSNTATGRVYTGIMDMRYGG